MVDDADKTRRLDLSKAKSIEEELYATLRQQVERLHPVQLPMTDFWKRSGALLDHIEGELNNAVKNEGHTLRSHTASRRQANVRRVMTELARKRLVSMLNHAVSSTLGPEGEASSAIPALDWNKHDPAEQKFHNQCIRLVESFMADVNWSEMQKGAGVTHSIPKLPSGTKQLDAFVKKPGGLTGRGPPPIDILMAEEKEIDIQEIDEEDRIAQMEAYPEMMEMANQQTIEEKVEDVIEEKPVASAPSKSMTLDDLIQTGSNKDPIEEKVVLQEKDVSQTIELLRIRIIESSDEPIMTSDGELNLEVGDVHQLNQVMANYLINSGVAEAAPL
jgi:hypothetical protein